MDGWRKYALALAAPLVSSFLVLPSPVYAATSEARVSAISSLNAGTAALQSGRSLEAVEYLNVAIESGALSAEGLALAYHHRGIAHQKLSLTGHAVADYTNAIWQGGLPVNVLPRSYYNRAVAYSQMGQQDRAEQDYNKTIELQPDYAAAFHNRGNLRRNLGRHAEAVADYTQALALGMADGSHLTYFARALSNRELGATAEAVRDAQQALAVKSDFPVARAALAEWGPAPVVAVATPAPQTPATSIAQADPADGIITASLPEVAPMPVVTPVQVAAPKPVTPQSASVEQIREPSRRPQPQASDVTSPDQPLTLLPPQVAAIEPQTGNVTVAPLSQALPPARGGEGWTATVTRFADRPRTSGPSATGIANDGYTQGRAAVPASPAGGADNRIVTASIDPSGATPSIDRAVNANGQARIQPVLVAQNETDTSNDAGANATVASGPRAQIASFRSAAEATTAWDKITRKFGTIIGQRQPYIAEANLGARGIYYRLQIGGFSTADEAKALCVELKEAGQDCIIAR
ncbi:MAG: tetratricopeptide repeat protein [Parvibaculum sp.]